MLRDFDVARDPDWCSCTLAKCFHVPELPSVSASWRTAADVLLVLSHSQICDDCSPEMTFHLNEQPSVALSHLDVVARMIVRLFLDLLAMISEFNQLASNALA